jgi:hypothetical protein
MRWLLVCLSACGFSDLHAVTVTKPFDDSFTAFADDGEAEDAAVMPTGDLVVAGCDRGGGSLGHVVRISHVFVTRLDARTLRPVWTERVPSPCRNVDNWSVPRVAVSERGQILVAGVQDLLVFDEHGSVVARRELAAGLRVRALVGLPGGSFAYAGQDVGGGDASTAFVAAVDSRAAELWRTALTGAHARFVDSLAVADDAVLAGVTVEGSVELRGGVAHGRESVGLVTELRARDGASVGTWPLQYAGVNISDIRVAAAAGATYVACTLDLRAGRRWPGELPMVPGGAKSAIFVEPLAAKPAWRRAIPSDNYISVASLAAAPERVAFAFDMQAGAVDLGRGEWRARDFDVAGYAELASPTGELAEARRLATSGEYAKVFPRRVIWDGARFAVVGSAKGAVHTAVAVGNFDDDVPYVWR